MPANESIPTSSQCVWLRRQAGLATCLDDFPDGEFFDITLACSTRERKYLHPTPTLPIPAEMVYLAEVEVVVDEPKLKWRKVKGTAKARSRETIAK